jgi:hypothetical protein
MNCVYLPLAKVAEQLPEGRTGKPVHTTTIARWITHGVRITGGERVMLRGVRLPGGWRTTQEWIDEFLETLTKASLDGARRPKPAPTPALDPIRQFEIDRSIRNLKAMGF